MGWCPFTTKKELVDWAAGYFEEPKAKFKKMSIKQLFAIFYRVHNGKS